MRKIPVGILGATGNVGQRFVQLLEGHPWFEVKFVCASEKSLGKRYEEIVNWKVSPRIPKDIAKLKVRLCVPDFNARVVFSALDSSVAGPIEEEFAKKGYIVISNSKNHRMDSDVPLLIPEVNPEHLDLINIQKTRFKGKGFIVTNPNCTTIGLTLALKPLQDAFGISRVSVVSMQALSGAGYPGVASLDAVDNVVPYIGDEEEKVETEPLKLLGSVGSGKINNAKMIISAHCNRVAVRDGHLESVTVELIKKPAIEDVVKAFKSFKGLPQKLNLPSAPADPIIVRTEEDRPQPVLDRDINNGMSVSVGRIRQSAIFDIKFTLLVHNTIRGAAGAAILNAELLKAKKLI
ncbi:MAG: aspartate-semialdehyde dehydrogenase [Candidatus Levybacteria bacterium]|nr:aspartate-semialdehyde dehydrogenase [Candidatus Levybacteria bacterium]